jgi:hypothetical protein
VFHGCGSLHVAGGGDLAATFQTLALFVRVLSGHYPHGDWQTAPEPPPQAQMPDAETAPAVLAVPKEAVPGPVEIRPVSIPDAVTQSQEVTVLGVSLAAPTWWSLLLSTFAYVLPLVLYVAWVSIALWDLIRQESVSTRRRLWWMVVVLIVPFIGPLLYFAFGRSPIPASLRLMLTGGAFLIYVAIGALAIVIGGN